MRPSEFVCDVGYVLMVGIGFRLEDLLILLSLREST